jgi:Helix-turn-helix domain
METLSMNAMERRRLTVFSRVKEHELSVAQARLVLNLSERQTRRLWKQYRERGDAGLVHGLRGRPSNAAHGAVKAQVLAAYRAQYRGFSAAHARDFLARDKLPVPRTTCWRWLQAAGLIESPRRIKQHRQRRARRSALGEMIQMDGSTHAWFGPAFPPAVLFVMIDDASSAVFARLYATEDRTTAFDLFGRYARRFGLPLALYVDRDSIYKVNDPEALRKAHETGRKEPLTQFGRAMRDLGVKMIFAHSPQAKGRVERVNRTFQDRLVKELQWLGLTTIAEANAYLEQTFLKTLNELIHWTPASGANLHQLVPRQAKLEEVLCVIEPRAVGQDWCVTYDHRLLQIHPRHQPLALAGKRIQVLQGAEGRLQLRHQGRPLSFTELARRPVATPVRAFTPTRHTPWQPGPSHPWNRSVLNPRPDGIRSA